MPELLVDFISSLDGYAAAEGWPGWWGLQGPEYLAWLGEQPEADYTILMGATTYRVMSRFVAAGEPGTDALVGMPKVVFSTTLSEPFSWANTELVAGEAVEAVREMKTEGSKSMRTIGSLTLCRSLLNAGLVDRFRVEGRIVAGFAAFKDHLSYLPFSGSVLPALASEFEGYTMTKSALHFPVDRPLPKTLVRKLIAARRSEAPR